MERKPPVIIERVEKKKGNCTRTIFFFFPVKSFAHFNKSVIWRKLKEDANCLKGGGKGNKTIKSIGG